MPSEMFVCGSYDRAAKTLKRLFFVLTVEEEIKQKYTTGDVVYVGNRVYKLGERQLVNECVVQYDLNLIKQ